MERKPLLFLSNDDGVEAKGLKELIRCLRSVGDLIVVAPDAHRSGYSASITSDIPLRCEKVDEQEGLVIYKCSGTPVDCVKLGLHVLSPRTPDMVIGGINHGDNSSVNVHYSGTMGVVIEGCLKRIPSVGFSLCDHNPDADFSPALPYVRRITEEVLVRGLPEGTCLNVNFPALSVYKGVKICHQNRGEWVKEFVDSRHPHGGRYYWLTGEYETLEGETEKSDYWALKKGFVAITPTRTDMTDYTVMDEMEHWNLNV